jgi:integrase
MTGHARLSYRRAEEIFRAASGGWTLHQLRHSAITHLAEAALIWGGVCQVGRG